MWKKFLVFDVATDIKAPKAGVGTDSPIYNIHGQLLKNPHKGINIINGKKVLVK